jgi:hypothetical protein
VGGQDPGPGPVVEYLDVGGLAQSAGVDTTLQKKLMV